jgi:hypothetical protein
VFFVPDRQALFGTALALDGIAITRLPRALECSYAKFDYDIMAAGIDTGTLTLQALYNSSVVNSKAATILLEEFLKVLQTVTREGSQRPIAQS